MSSTGTVKIRTVTSGTEPDPDGYTVTIDTEAAKAIGPTDSLDGIELTPGNHAVLLGGLADNCSLNGDNPRMVSVTAGETSAVMVEVICTATTAVLEITTRTSGESQDPDGFGISIDGQQDYPIATSGTLAIHDLSAGTHTAVLTGVAENCSAAEGSSQTVELTAGVSAPLTFTIACSFAGATHWTTIPLPASVTAQHPFEHSKTLWGSSPNDLFVIGTGSQPDGSSIWHYDGHTWTEQVSRGTGFGGIWGTSSSDVYAIGGPHYLVTPEIGTILHYDGVHWTDVVGPAYTGNPTGFEYNAVWEASPTAVFLGGRIFRTDSAGQVLPKTELLVHFDGSRWSEMETPGFGYYPTIANISGTSATDVWALGNHPPSCDDCEVEYALAVHYDGQGWSEKLTVHAVYFRGIWAAAPNDVWVVGENDEGNAYVWHFNGSIWSEGEPLSTSEYGLSDIWGSSGSDLYAVGPRTLLHYDGTHWRKIQDLGGDRVWGTSRQDVFVLKEHEILHGTP
ncbi:MAG: hypothetical protein ACJ8DC_07355 [Gemmatimonadales bacterium]